MRSVVKVTRYNIYSKVFKLMRYVYILHTHFSTVYMYFVSFPQIAYSAKYDVHMLHWPAVSKRIFAEKLIQNT